MCPFVLEATGSWGGKAKHLTQLITQKYALRHGCTLKEAGIVCRTKLQLSLLRSLARQLERGFPTSSGCDEVDNNDLCWF